MGQNNLIKQFLVGFYNVENLFDAEHTEFTLDTDYTPEGKFEWTEHRYQRKLENLATAIVKLGTDQIDLPPVFLGLAEVENSKVLSDLIATQKLSQFNYDFVHYESPDERGVDVAFLYRKDLFELIYSDVYPLEIYDEFDARDYTRDILLIHGSCFGEKIFIIVNHWPSRNNGKNHSENKRISAAKKVRNIVQEIYAENPEAFILIMGDFNDGPKSRSIKNYLMSENFYNPMLELQQYREGSLIHLGKWHLFDQIILSNNFLQNEKISFSQAGIFKADFLRERRGTRGGPLRTYMGKHYIGGFSDHFPVYAIFSLK